MKTLERTEAIYRCGGWNVYALLLAPVYALLPLGLIAWAVADGAWEMSFVIAFCVAICGGLLWSLNFRDLVTFDRAAGEACFDQLRIVGWRQTRTPLEPDARVEIESTQTGTGSRRRRARRMVLVTGDRRVPFHKLFYTHDFKDQAAALNEWLGNEGPPAERRRP